MVVSILINCTDSGFQENLDETISHLLNESL